MACKNDSINQYYIQICDLSDSQNDCISKKKKKMQTNREKLRNYIIIKAIPSRDCSCE